MLLAGYALVSGIGYRFVYWNDFVPFIIHFYMIWAQIQLLKLWFLKQRSQQSFHFIINVMLLIDSIVLLLIIVILHVIKFKYPNFLFFCKGAVLFLPPNEQKPKTQNTKTSKKEKQEVQINILQIQYQHVKEYPMSDQYDRLLFLIVGLVLYIPIKLLICLIVDLVKGQPFTIPSSSFTFIVCLVAFVYAIKLGLQIFWISPYPRKYCFLVAIGANILFFMLYMTISGLGTYDSQILQSISDYRKQLSIIFSKKLIQQRLSIQSILVFVLIINLILTLVSIPSVIKFGNWYTKTLKEIYYQDEQTSKIVNAQQRKQKQQQQAQLKKKCKFSIRLLNIYLVAILVFLFFSHSYPKGFIDDKIIDLIRVLLMALITFINCYTLKDAIEFNGSFAYKFINEYALSNSVQERRKLRQKIVPYIYLIWYHKFQFMFRVIIPVLLFMMIFDWKYMHLDDKPLQSLPIISHTHCGVNTNQLSILQNLYKCDSTQADSLIHSISQSFINGVMIAGKNSEEVSTVQERIARYGILNRHFMEQFLEQILWYSNITVYAMTVIYILFLRKTVYDI